MPVSLMIACCCMGVYCISLSSSEGILGGRGRGAAGLIADHQRVSHRQGCSLLTCRGGPWVWGAACSPAKPLLPVTCRGGPSEIIKHGKSGFQVDCSCVGEGVGSLVVVQGSQGSQGSGSGYLGAF